jgi:DNA polymerase III delta prime subunit
MKKIENEFLWVERYRPQTIDDCVLPKDLKDTFNAIVSSGQIPNIMLTGTSGLGKTTVAKAMCNMLNLDYIMINGSEENGIDVLRNKIKQFASTLSLSGGYKVVIIDEADYLPVQSTQVALRGFIEEFSNNCRFILTCNFKNRIIEPLHSRCSVIEFNTTKKSLASLAGEFMKRLTFILKNEGIKYDEKTIADLIIRHAPDWRRVIGECQRYSNTGEIPSAILVGMSDQNIAELTTYLRTKDFKSMRGWVVNNSSHDSTVIFRKIYDSLYDYAAPASIPAAVLILADYSYKSSFMADKELNIVACCTELMSNIEWSKK